MEEELLTVVEVAALIKCSKFTVYGMVARKKIPFKKPSRRLLRFKKTEIMDWIDGKFQDAPGRTTSSVRTRSKQNTKSTSNVRGIVDLAKKEVLGF